jgi:hypothetical protein
MSDIFDRVMNSAPIAIIIAGFIIACILFFYVKGHTVSGPLFMAGILLMIFGLIVLPLGMIFYKAFVNKDFKQITNATLTCKNGHVSRLGQL